jgi:hypothetical protein
MMTQVIFKKEANAECFSKEQVEWIVTSSGILKHKCAVQLPGKR